VARIDSFGSGAGYPLTPYRDELVFEVSVMDESGTIYGSDGKGVVRSTKGEFIDSYF
jgi:hypothetical protein